MVRARAAGRMPIEAKRKASTSRCSASRARTCCWTTSLAGPRAVARAVAARARRSPRRDPGPAAGSCATGATSCRWRAHAFAPAPTSVRERASDRTRVRIAVRGENPTPCRTVAVACAGGTPAGRLAPRVVFAATPPPTRSAGLAERGARKDGGGRDAQSAGRGRLAGPGRRPPRRLVFSLPLNRRRTRPAAELAAGVRSGGHSGRHGCPAG